jgi:putative ABC transport system substrate-binding protein
MSHGALVTQQQFGDRTVPTRSRAGFIVRQFLAPRRGGSVPPYGGYRRGAALLLAELAGELLADALPVALASSPGSDQQPVPPLRRSHSPRVYRPMVAFMAANRLPAIYSGREFVEAGGLIGYSTNYDDLLRQAAGYVDRILKGESPGELPAQQAATFELRINLAAAKALELTVPPSILARADEILE